MYKNRMKNVSTHSAFIITQRYYNNIVVRQARTGTGRADPASLEQAHGLPYHKNCNLRHNYTNQ